MSLKTYSLIAAGLALLSLLYTVYSSYQELKAFKEDVLTGQAQLQEQMRKQEQKLNASVLQISEQASFEVSSINDAYTKLLNERGVQHHADGNNGRLSDAARVASNVRPSEAAQPPATSAHLSTKLKRCEARLIYEAKEYDILATHYNALLNIYKQAQGVINGNGKEDGDHQGHD